MSAAEPRKPLQSASVNGPPSGESSQTSAAPHDVMAKRPLGMPRLLVKNAPEKDKAKKVLDFLLSDKGQAIWTNAYLHPARNVPLPAEVEKRFLPAKDYERAKSVNWGDMSAVQKAFVDRYLAEVR